MVGIFIDLAKYRIDFILVDADIAINETAPVIDYLLKVVKEFLKTDGRTPILVHHCKAELILFIFSTVAENVHNLGEL